jgi:hypothetical protein
MVVDIRPAVLYYILTVASKKNYAQQCQNKKS